MPLTFTSTTFDFDFPTDTFRFSGATPEGAKVACTVSAGSVIDFDNTPLDMLTPDKIAEVLWERRGEIEAAASHRYDTFGVDIDGMVHVGAWEPEERTAQQGG